MAVKGYFFNAVKTGDTYDRLYDAESFCKYLHGITSDGVVASSAEALKVNASGGMTVTVKTGEGFINGKKIENTSDLSLTLPTPDTSLPRIDAIIMCVDYLEREARIIVRRGEPSVTPVPPVLYRNANEYDLCLAQISVAANASQISQMNITDTRGNTELCGWVVGLIQQIDTTNLFDQFTDAFETWFNDIKDAYTSKVLSRIEYTHTTTGNSEATFDVQSFISSYNFSTDILMVYISGLFVPESDYITSNASITLDTPITHPGTKITFVVLKNAMTTT